MKVVFEYPMVATVELSDGVPGPSSYDLAVRQGFTGTLNEWLADQEGASVETGNGPPVDDGRKADQPYLDADTGDIYAWSGTEWVLSGNIASTVPGPPNTLTIGTVGSGATPAATITGTSPNQTLNLTLVPGIGVPTTGNNPGDLMRWNGSVWIQTVTKFFEGTGDPNGVVTAPVGSTFVNTEAGGFNGARRWTKATGTGNTGWVVVDGDTGWADIQAYLTADWVKRADAWATCDMRRVNGDVQFRLNLQSTKTSGSVGGNVNVFSGLPAAWRPSALIMGTAGYFESPNGPATFSYSGSGWGTRAIGVAGTYTESTRLNGSFAIPTTDAWPSTLP